MADETAIKISQLDPLPNGDMAGYYTIGSKDNAQGNPTSYKMDLGVLKTAIANASTAVANANQAVSAAQAAVEAFNAAIVQLTGQNTNKVMSQKAVTDALATLSANATQLSGQIGDILDMIPSAASTSNQLADKAFVNSSVSTATATFRGTSAAGLSETQFKNWANSLTHDINDYVYWNTTDSAGNTIYKRYKYDGLAWVFEYDLNNSSFTAAEWAAIQSGITSQKVSQFTAKYDKPSSGIPNTDLASTVQASLGLADTAVQPDAIEDCLHLGTIIENNVIINI